MIRTPSRHARIAREPDEGGYTLTEIIVAMGIFVVVVAVFVTATTTMYKDLRKQTGITDAADMGRKVYTEFDKNARYASAVNTPGADSSGKNWFVEYLVPTAGATSGTITKTCTQWKYDTSAGTIAYRQWKSTGGTVTAPRWIVIAQGVTNSVASKPPFTVTAPTATRAYQTLNLDVQIARNNPKGKLETQSSFVALNSTSSTPSTLPVCQEVARS